MSEMIESVNDSVPAKAPLTRRQKAKRQCLRNLALVVLAVTALNAAVTSVMIAWHSPVTVSFDIKSTVDQFTEQATEKGYDEAEMGLMTNRFTFSLNRALEDYQREHDATILVRPAVVSGVPDITDEIQRDIGRRMAEWP
ncbi:type-F conjugative transfer system protein TrbI [Enterobacter huaxiensis]|uniref:type-F conjugative transfer system protein TrbI n=1 Tax=Enterobacter huaxiensis TaxID=2494702 RepID=UPI0021DAFE73|nr:type-F conjugative transfer system protein TrbI [Enterobacter huaxiensis]